LIAASSANLPARARAGRREWSDWAGSARLGKAAADAAACQQEQRRMGRCAGSHAPLHHAGASRSQTRRFSPSLSCQHLRFRMRGQARRAARWVQLGSRVETRLWLKKESCAHALGCAQINVQGLLFLSQASMQPFQISAACDGSSALAQHRYLAFFASQVYGCSTPP
jgi:hypothetical protein